MDKKEFEKGAGEVADGFRAALIWTVFWPILLPIIGVLFLLGLFCKKS